MLPRQPAWSSFAVGSIITTSARRRAARVPAAAPSAARCGTGSSSRPKNRQTGPSAPSTAPARSSPRRAPFMSDAPRPCTRPVADQTRGGCPAPAPCRGGRRAGSPAPLARLPGQHARVAQVAHGHAPRRRARPPHVHGEPRASSRDSEGMSISSSVRAASRWARSATGRTIARGAPRRTAGRTPRSGRLPGAVSVLGPELPADAHRRPRDRSAVARRGPRAAPAGRVRRPALRPPGSGRRSVELRAGGARFEPALRRSGAWRSPLAVATADLGLTLAASGRSTSRRRRGRALPRSRSPPRCTRCSGTGSRPHFVDVDPATWCVTAATARCGGRRPRRRRSRAPAHSVRLRRGRARGARRAPGAARCGAAQAFATLVGSHAGTFGDASVFSFSPTKIATAGEGGLAVFRDPLRRVASAAARLRQRPGVRQPAGRAQREALGAARGAGLPTVPGWRTRSRRAPPPSRGTASGWPGCGRAPAGVAAGIRATPTQLVVDSARPRRGGSGPAGRRIESRPYFRPLHAMPRFAGLARAPLGVTEALGARSLALPLHSAMGAEDVDRVCDALLAVA